MTTLSKIVLSVVVILATTDISFAQSYSLIPNDTVNMVGIMEDLETLSIQQINTSSETIQLKWAKVSESVPVFWETSVCDNQICYTSLVDSGSMSPINPALYGFLLLHITPHINYGTAVIRYAVWDVVNPASKDTLTYILTVSPTSAIANAENKNAFMIFPNPTKGDFTITSTLLNGFEYSITDATGKEISNGISNNEIQTISTTKLSNGHYTVSFFNENKIISTKKIIVQQ